MAKRTQSRRSMAMRGIIFLVAMVCIAVAGYLIGENLEKEGVKEKRATMSEGFGRYEEKISDGETYYKKTNVTTLLFMGVDRDVTDETRISYRSGGQADFLLLMVIDHESKVIRQLQINRDTLAKVDVLTILGAPGGVRRLQICLAHGYGATQEECCDNQLRAVSRYLDNTELDLYMAVDYSVIDRINAMLGGVTVTLHEDFSHLDPEMTLGSTITLKGHQAELYVRSRMSVGDGTNAARQIRQREWMNGAMTLMRERIKEDNGYFETFIEGLGDNLMTNVAQGRLINEFNQAWQYEVLPVEEIPGEYVVGSNGYIQYITQPEAVTEWILHALYRPASV